MFKILLDDKNITSYISDFDSLKLEVIGDLQFQIRSNSVTFDIYLQFLHLFNIQPKEFSQLYDKIVKIYYLDQLKFKGVLKSIDYDVKGNTYQVGVDGIDKIIYDTEIETTGYDKTANKTINNIAYQFNSGHAEGVYADTDLNIDNQPTYKGVEVTEKKMYYYRYKDKYGSRLRFTEKEIEIALAPVWITETTWVYRLNEGDWKTFKNSSTLKPTTVFKREVDDKYEDYFQKYAEIEYPDATDIKVVQVAAKGSYIDLQTGDPTNYLVVLKKEVDDFYGERTLYFINEYKVVDQDKFTYDIDGTVGKALKDVALLTNSVFRITPDNRLEFQSTKYTTGTTHNYRSNQIKELKLTTTEKDGEIDLSGDFAVFPRIDLQAFYNNIYKSNYYQYEITIPKETGDFLLDAIYIDNINYGKVFAVEYGEFITLKTEKIDNFMSEAINV